MSFGSYISNSTTMIHVFFYLLKRWTPTLQMLAKNSKSHRNLTRASDSPPPAGPAPHRREIPNIVIVGFLVRAAGLEPACLSEGF